MISSHSVFISFPLPDSLADLELPRVSLFIPLTSNTQFASVRLTAREREREVEVKEKRNGAYMMDIFGGCRRGMVRTKMHGRFESREGAGGQQTIVVTNT